QTATGKEISNPLIANSLLKTISCEEEDNDKRQRFDLVFHRNSKKQIIHSEKLRNLKTAWYNSQKPKLKDN
ncbi:hypothetical protein Tco_0485009, partial [Tanacetum coccineum]